jgi:hypothetical protein
MVTPTLKYTFGAERLMAWQTTDVVEYQPVVWQTVLPIVALGVELTVAKLIPINVTLLRDVAGEFGGFVWDMIGTSNVNNGLDVPITPVTLTPTTRSLKESAILPAEQAAYVEDVHEKQAQARPPMVAEAVESNCVPKLRPVIVTTASPDATELNTLTYEMTGESKVKMEESVPTTVPRVRPECKSRPVPNRGAPVTP